jgi:hypothetical protein
MEQRWDIERKLLRWQDALIGDERREFLEHFATEVIKHRSHSRKKKTEIAMWMHDSFPPRGAMTSFVHNTLSEHSRPKLRQIIFVQQCSNYAI